LRCLCALHRFAKRDERNCLRYRETVHLRRHQAVHRREVRACGGYSADELLLIAQVVQEEAKGTDVEARAAVANIIYNRLNSSKFPNSVEGVLFQKNQFTVTRNEEKLRAVMPISKTVEAVNQIFIGGDMILPDDVLYFRSSKKGTSWDKRVYYATYGGNSFFY